MAMNTLSNYGERLLLNNLIEHDGETIADVVANTLPAPHNVLTIALFFEEYKEDPDNAGQYIAVAPNGESAPGVAGSGLGKEVGSTNAASQNTGYVRQKVWFDPAGTVGGVTTMKNKGTGEANSITEGAVSFPTALNDWTIANRGDTQPSEQIKYMAIIDTEAVGGAKVIWYGEVKDSSGVAKTKIVQKDDVLRFAVDSITLSLD